jgi:hypothetical protein
MIALRIAEFDVAEKIKKFSDGCVSTGFLSWIPFAFKNSKA